MNLKLFFVGLLAGSMVGLASCGDSKTSDRKSGDEMIGNVSKTCFYLNAAANERDKNYGDTWHTYNESNSEENCLAYNKAIDEYIEFIESIRNCPNISQDELAYYTEQLVTRLNEDKKYLSCKK